MKTPEDEAFMVEIRAEIAHRTVNRGLDFDELRATILDAIREVSAKHKLIWLIPTREEELADRFAVSMEQARRRRIGMKE